MRQSIWNPGATKADVSELRIHPDKPAHPFSSNSSSKQKQVPTASKSNSLMAKTKTSRNSPDPTSNMPDRNASHTSQKSSAVASRKRSIEKTSHPNSVPMKKKTRSYGRQSSKTSEPDGAQSDDQGYGSDIKLSKITQTSILVENGEHISSVDVPSIDLTRKRFRPEASAIVQQTTPAFLNRKHEHRKDCHEFPAFDASDPRQSTHVRFDIDGTKNGRTTQPQSSDSEAQQFSSPPPASGDSDSVSEIVDEMEEDDTANSFQFAKQTQLGDQKVNFWKIKTDSPEFDFCARRNWRIGI